MSDNKDWDGRDRRADSAYTDKHEYVTKHQAFNIAQEAGRAAVVELLTALGIDTSDQGAVIQQQVDFAYLRRTRTQAEKFSVWMKMTIIGFAASGAVTAFWQGFKLLSKKSGG